MQTPVTKAFVSTCELHGLVSGDSWLSWFLVTEGTGIGNVGQIHNGKHFSRLARVSGNKGHRQSRTTVEQKEPLLHRTPEMVQINARGATSQLEYIARSYVPIVALRSLYMRITAVWHQRGHKLIRALKFVAAA